MIQQTEKQILDALSCVLRDEEISWADKLDEQQWKHLLNLCFKHKVLPLIFDAFPHETLELQREGVLSKYVGQVQREIIFQAKRTGEFCLLYRYLRSKGLHPLVMKGIVCRSLYSEPEHRSSVDEDLLVKPAEFRRLHEAMLEYGLELNPKGQEPGKQFEVSYVDRERGILVEVHKTPFSPDSPYLDRMNDCFLGVHDRAISQQIYGMDFLTLGLEDHLLYLLLHALKHFLFCGFGIRQICDIALYAEAHRIEIDWQNLRTRLENVGAMDFVRAVFRIAGEHLLPDNHMTEYLLDWDLASIDPEPLLADVIEGGIYGCSTMSRTHSSNMTLRAASVQSAHGSSAVLYSLFPPLEAMKSKCPYLKKLPLLLPVAWMQRLIRYIWELFRHRGKSNSALTSIRVGNERIRLLEEYNIIKS